MKKTDNDVNVIRPVPVCFACLLMLLMIGVESRGEPVKNGFDLENSLVPPSQIKGGGPPKDGIPALTNPDMIKAEDADYLKDSDLVIGVKIKNDIRAFPLNILVHHEAVNDVVGEVPVAVTY